MNRVATLHGFLAKSPYKICQIALNTDMCTVDWFGHLNALKQNIYIYFSFFYLFEIVQSLSQSQLLFNS